MDYNRKVIELISYTLSTTGNEPRRMSNLMEGLQIRYIKLHFTLVFTEDGQLPRHKASALRGGMGRALLTANCIRNENCDSCDFSEDCLVQRMM